jgi:hypothetical protein
MAGNKQGTCKSDIPADFVAFTHQYVVFMAYQAKAPGPFRRLPENAVMCCEGEPNGYD